MENNFREQWVGGWTLRKPDKRDSAREEMKVSSFPQHYLAVDVKYLIYFCLITKGLFIYPNMSGNYNGCSLLYPGTCIHFASVDIDGVPAFLIRVAFSSKGHKFWGKQSFSRVPGNVTYVQDVGKTDEVSEIDDYYKQPRNKPKLCVTSETGCWHGL